MKRIAALLVAFLLTLSLAACGGEDGATALKNYIESEDFRTRMAAQMEQYAESGLTLEITSEGERLVYTCTFNTQLEIKDGGADFADALEKQPDAFESIATRLKTELNLKQPSVLVRYVNADGSEIASKEFFAK